MREWVDAKKYFVRIDGRKIVNTRLENYHGSDFSYYSYYVPTKKATDYGKYEAQVNLQTNESFVKLQEDYKLWYENNEYHVGWRSKPKASN